MRCVLLFVAFAHSAYASAISPQDSQDSLHGNILRAAKRDYNLHIQRPEFRLGFDTQLTYTENITSGPALSSHVRLQSDRPLLLLEDYDHHFVDVRCYDSTMHIDVRSAYVFEKAQATCSSLVGGLLIASHFSCGDDGAHTIYKVLNVRFDTDASRIIFGLEESNIRQEFRSITIEFETSSNRHYIHQHDRLFRRASGDLATSDISPLSAADVLRAASSSTQGNNQTNVKDLGFKSNATFFDPIDLGCTDCVGKGQMVTTVGDLKFELFPDNDDDPIKTGFIQLEIKGFEMSLGLHVTPSAEFLRYKKNIYRVPTPLKLGVPKIFSLGIEILLEAFIETKTNSTAEIQFGFDVKIPDSGVLLNVAEFQDSQIWGFDKTKITPKLLAANTSDLTFNLKGGLRPKIVAKLDLIGVAKVEGGPYFTLPEITLNAKQLGSDKVGANCEAGGATHEKFKDAFKNLTQVEYGVALAAGFGLGLDVLGLSVMSKSKDVWKPGDLATKTTQCLAYEKTGTASGFALATSVLQKMTSTPTPTVTATKGTSSGYQLWDFRGSPLIVLVWASSVIIPVLL